MREGQDRPIAQARPLPAVGERRAMVEYLGSLRHRDFRLLWVGGLALSSTSIFQFFAVARLIESYFPVSWALPSPSF